jgi:Pterin 4 alpha carbinolamine dehydratase
MAKEWVGAVRTVRVAFDHAGKTVAIVEGVPPPQAYLTSSGTGSGYSFPNLHLTGYRKVAIELSTHDIGGLSENDLILAAKIDQLPVKLKE